MQKGMNDDVHVVVVLDIIQANVTLKVWLVREVIGWL